MIVRLLFFGATASVVGTRRLSTAVNDRAAAAHVIEQLRHEYPELRNHKLLFAVNEEYVVADTRLNEGDELAIFTAVSGG